MLPLPQRRQLRRDHGALAFVQMPAVQVLRHDESLDRADAIPLDGLRFDAETLTGEEAIATVDHGGLVDHDRVALPVVSDIHDQTLELVGAHRREDFCGWVDRIGGHRGLPSG